MSEKKVTLTCACCGKYAGRHVQYPNQDKGFGICSNCVTWLKESHGCSDAFIRTYYGVAGVNYEAPRPSEQQGGG